MIAWLSLLISQCMSVWLADLWSLLVSRCCHPSSIETTWNGVIVQIIPFDLLACEDLPSSLSFCLMSNLILCKLLTHKLCKRWMTISFAMHISPRSVLWFDLLSLFRWLCLSLSLILLVSYYNWSFLSHYSVSRLSLILFIDNLKILLMTKNPIYLLLDFSFIW